MVTAHYQNRPTALYQNRPMAFGRNRPTAFLPAGRCPTPPVPVPPQRYRSRGIVVHFQLPDPATDATLTHRHSGAEPHRAPLT
ncbi:hypothetical protein DVH05_017715 [Phytophthora capsici]|nr:hypothetical protein DVH05_017715 [Phytophthora capsici]